MIFSSILFYVGFTIYRQWEFQRYDTQNHVSITLQKQKDIKNPYTPDQSKLDFYKFNDRILIDRNTKDINVLSQYFYDYILLGDEIVENNYYNLDIIIRFFDVYAKQFSNKELRSDVWFSYSFVYSVIDPTSEKISALDPTSEKTIYLKLNDYVTMWEKKAGKREGKWWDNFQNSDEYRIFLSETFKNIDRPAKWIYLGQKKEDYRTVEEIYFEILSFNKSENNSIRNLVIYKYTPSNMKELARKVYLNYKEHIKEEDVVRAYVDSALIYIIWDRMNRLETSPLWFRDHPINTQLILGEYISGFPTNIYLDILMVISMSLLISILVTGISFWRETRKSDRKT